MRIEELDYPSYKIIRFYNNDQIGSVEMVDNYIENMFIDEKYRGKGYFRGIINYLKLRYNTLTCLPLPEHRAKFKHLGFEVYNVIRGDIFYILQ